MYEVTKGKFKTFCKEVKYWANKLGLKSWEIIIYCEYEADADCLEGARGGVVIQNIELIAQIFLNKEWSESPDDYELRRTAFHEVWHIPLSDVSHPFYSAMSPIDIQTVEKGEHSVIRILENTMFKDDYNRRFPQRRRK